MHKYDKTVQAFGSSRLLVDDLARVLDLSSLLEQIFRRAPNSPYGERKWFIEEYSKNDSGRVLEADWLAVSA